MNYIKKHWRGELPFSISFWVNLALLNVVVSFLFFILEIIISGFYPPLMAKLFLLFLILNLIIVYPWQIVGAWRASERYVKNKGSRFLSGGAKVIIIFGVIATVLDVSIDYPIYLSSFQLGFKKDTFATYSIELNSDKSLLHISGGIGFGISKETSEIIKANKTITGVVLDSKGGRIYEGRELFKLIKSHNLNTYTILGCYSACAIAFMGGENRTITNNANLAFHQYSSFSDAFAASTDLKKEQNIDKNLFIQQGVSKEFLDRVYKTESDDLWFPTKDELIAANVVHDIQSASDILPIDYPDIESFTYEDADKLLQETSAFQAIKKYEPDAYESLVKTMHSKLRKGATSKEIGTVVRLKLANIFMKYLPKTSNAALINWATTMVSTLKTLSQSDPIQCIKFIYPDQYGTSNYTNLISQQHQLEMLELFNQIIVDSYTHDIPNIDTQSAETVLDKIVLEMGDGVSYLELEGLQNKEDYRNSCNAFLQFYSLVGDEDPQIAANVLRYALLNTE